MSYLHPTRLTFAGRFQADVSTVNNDVRHYENATFQPDFQNYQTATSLNGWWNPTGSGAFRFVGCRVTSVSQGGAVSTAADNDGTVGADIVGAADRSAGKLVDIDPQWQLASAPWGVGLRLVAGGVELLRGEYKSNAFRDLWFSRLVGSSQDGAASSTFQSVLTDVVFTEAGLDRSSLLRALRDATFGDRLSIRLTTFGYNGRASSPTFTLGTLIGTIGPALAAEPESFVRGRRFAPASGFQSYGAGITYFSAAVDAASKHLLLDVSNALQIIDGQGTAMDIGDVSAGALLDDAVAENTPVTAENFVALGAVPYRDEGWLDQTGGIVELPLDETQFALVAKLPLALAYEAPFNPGGTGEGDGAGVVAIRETAGGLFVGAEPSVIRLDAGTSTEVGVWAALYGRPIDAQEIRLRQLGRVPDQGGSGQPDPQVDSIKIPDIGVPETALRFPASVPLVGGTARVLVEAGDPGNPRGYLDGQVYLVDYRLPGQGNSSRHPFDFIVIHVRDAYAVPDQPAWATDVQPILAQFGNLYPVMSRGFIDLGDETVVLANRDFLALALSRPIDDPNHMPVTRDLSEPKRTMLLKYLAGAMPAAPREYGPTPVAGHRPDTPSPLPSGDDAPSASKSEFAARFFGAGRAKPPATSTEDPS